MQFGTYEHLAKKVVFIDGITRCGKSMFSGIIPSLTHMEHLNFICLLEQIVPGIAFGAMDAGYARSVMNLYFNELAYNMQLSRGVNFRPGDQTGVPNYRDPQIYQDRLTRSEGDEVVDSIRNNDSYLPFQTHDLMVHLEHLNKLDLNYWMISLWRHPVDMIHSWWKRGYGTRFRDDPRFFTLTIQYKEEVLPWYAKGREETCLKLNPMEFCVFLATDLIELAVEQFQKNNETRDRIHLTTFEDFAQETHREVLKLCTFLNVEVTDATEKFISKAKCPRVLKPDDRARKQKEFETNISPRLFKRLLQLSQSYEKNLYGLRGSPIK